MDSGGELVVAVGPGAGSLAGLRLGLRVRCGRRVGLLGHRAGADGLAHCAGHGVDDDDAAPPAYAPAAFEPAGIAAEAETQAPEPEWDDDEYDAPAVPASGLSGSPLVTFLPSDGAITLRVAPVAGFQGLMRIQDALTRLPVVRHASVEAYSQGEARLRIELADTSDSDEIAEGLARALRGPARVEDASEVNRELLIALR